MILRVLWLCAVASLVVTAADAKTTGPSKRDIEQHACYDDAMRLCKEFVPNEGKITTCMEQRRSELSPGCAALFETSDK